MARPVDTRITTNLQALGDSPYATVAVKIRRHGNSRNRRHVFTTRGWDIARNGNILLEDQTGEIHSFRPGNIVDWRFVSDPFVEGDLVVDKETPGRRGTVIDVLAEGVLCEFLDDTELLPPSRLLRGIEAPSDLLFGDENDQKLPDL